VLFNACSFVAGGPEPQEGVCPHAALYHRSGTAGSVVVIPRKQATSSVRGNSTIKTTAV